MKKTLSQAIAAATLMGAAVTAQAVNVDPNGHGQALLYPLYTVEQGNYSVLSVTNTTDKFKAVKVRFLEGGNSQEVLDFNLYLSPNDVWTGAVVPEGDTAKLVSTDKSCISAFPNGFPADGVKFRTSLFAQEGDAASRNARTRVGHIEIIEMGDIDDSALQSTLATVPGVGAVSVHDAIKHVNGEAPVCAAVNRAWNTGGTWATAPNTYMVPGSGGLYGTGYIINVDNAWSSSYDATALANMLTQIQHAKPGDMDPNFGAADLVAVFPNGTDGDTADGWDAVSAVLMKESIQNDYVVGAGLGAQTEMVVTFPTKYAYVNGNAAPKAPFTSRWGWDLVNDKASGKLEACEQVSVSYWDREEREEILEDEQISPAPVTPGFYLCHETNLVKISGSDIFGGDLVAHDLDLAFAEGWMNMAFTGGDLPSAVTGAREIQITDSGNTGSANPKGLPAIGFSTVVTGNGATSSGVLNTYAQSYQHKATITNYTE